MGMFILFCVSVLLNAFLVWVGMMITGLRARFLGLLVISAAGIAPNLLIPDVVGALIGSVLFWIAAYKLTNADSFVDIILLVIVTNVLSFLALLGTAKNIADKIEQKLQNQSEEESEDGEGGVNEEDSGGTDDQVESSLHESLGLRRFAGIPNWCRVS